MYTSCTDQSGQKYMFQQYYFNGLLKDTKVKRSKYSPKNNFNQTSTENGITYYNFFFFNINKLVTNKIN